MLLTLSCYLLGVQSMCYKSWGTLHGYGLSTLNHRFYSLCTYVSGFLKS